MVALTCTIAALKVFGPIYALTRGGPENATNVPSYFAYFTFFKKPTSATARRSPPCSPLIIVVVAVVFMRCRRARTEGSSMSMPRRPHGRRTAPRRRAQRRADERAASVGRCGTARSWSIVSARC